jgi:hypothetical protein
VGWLYSVRKQRSNELVDSVLVMALQDHILAAFCTNSRRPFNRAVQGRGMEGIDTRSSNRLFVRILLKEGFCVLYTHRDVVSLIWS